MNCPRLCHVLHPSMRRDLESLNQSNLDLLIIGGGIHGSIAAWDASLRGLSVALIDAGDFGAATSANSLKIVHGGLRYLQRADFRRMRESIRERSTLLAIAPHLIRPLPFVVGTSGISFDSKPALATALKIADCVGFDRNRRLPVDRGFPGGRVISRTRCLELFPQFDPAGLNGGAIWYEGQMLGSERLTLSFLISASEKGAVLANHVRGLRPIVEGGRVVGVVARDERGGQDLTVRCHAVLNAAGPWAEGFLESRPRPGLALAINLVTRRRWSEYGVGIRSRADARRDPVCGGGRYMFLTPWRSSTLLGTAYIPQPSGTDRPAVTSDLLKGFVNEWNVACPALELSIEDLSFYHRGLVPLKAGFESGRPDALAERSRIVDHGESHGIRGLVSLTGAKYTTARASAQSAIDRIFDHLGTTPPRCRTDELPIYGGSSHDGASGGAVETRLRENHGSAAGELAGRFAAADGWSEPLGPGSEILRGEVFHAVREEMALTLSDVVFRRTAMGAEARPGDGELSAAAAIMAAELGWSDARRKDEIGSVLEAYAPLTHTEIDP